MVKALRVEVPEEQVLSLLIEAEDKLKLPTVPVADLKDFLTRVSKVSETQIYIPQSEMERAGRIVVEAHPAGHTLIRLSHHPGITLVCHRWARRVGSCSRRTRRSSH